METLRVKAGAKVHNGKVVGSGTKSEVEKMITEFEALEGEGQKETEKSGEIDRLVTTTKILQFVYVVSLMFTCLQ